jgi:hypothetical protein
LRNPFKRREKQLTASANVPAAISSGWSALPLLGGGSRERIMDAYTTAKSANYAWIYANSPAVRTVVDVLVRNIGQLDLRLYEEISESERQARPDHPAALSLRYPNETQTSDGFLRSLLKDFLLFDDAYALLTPTDSGQITLNWIPAHMIEIKGANLFSADIYRFWRPEGWGYVDFTPIRSCTGMARTRLTPGRAVSLGHAARRDRRGRCPSGRDGGARQQRPAGARLGVPAR